MKTKLVALPLLSLCLLLTPGITQAETHIDAQLESAAHPAVALTAERTASSLETADRKRKKKNGVKINSLEELRGRLVNVKIKAKAPKNIRLTCRAPSFIDTGLLIQSLSSNRVAVTTPGNKTKIGKKNRKGFKVVFPTGGLFEGKTSTVKETIKTKFSANSVAVTVNLKQTIQPGVMCLVSYKGQFSRNVLE